MAVLCPLLARDRYSDEEWALASAGRCNWEVESGMVAGRVVRCGQPSSPASFYRHCRRHDAEAREYPTYGS